MEAEDMISLAVQAQTPGRSKTDRAEYFRQYRANIKLKQKLISDGTSILSDEELKEFEVQKNKRQEASRIRSQKLRDKKRQKSDQDSIR